MAAESPGNALCVALKFNAITLKSVKKHSLEIVLTPSHP
jgi:hypothetical protein